MTESDRSTDEAAQLQSRFEQLRLTERARATLAAASAEARRLSHNYLGTEHQLLGLLSEPEGVGARALLNLGVGLEAAREQVEFIVGRGDKPSPEGDLPPTPRAQKVLDLASAEGKALGHVQIGTEHLLLGLLREGEGIAAMILEALGVNHKSARAEITRMLKKDNVLTCRVNDQDLGAIDMLVEAGIRQTRSDAAAWLIQAGIAANQPLFRRVRETVDEIRRLRERAQAAARELAGTPAPEAEPPA
jgi:ATP-dependent Clp protease ATP-binding subunit ClpA